MYRNDVNERSPMRVFERSMHGGLGRGNVGVVASRPGVGKTPLLVQIGLDDLLREDRRCCTCRTSTRSITSARTTTRSSTIIAHVRCALEEPASACCSTSSARPPHLLAARPREDGAASLRGGATTSGPQDRSRRWRSPATWRTSSPDVIVIDGFDLSGAGMHEAFKALRTLARDLSAEVWISVHTPEAPAPNGPSSCAREGLPGTSRWSCTSSRTATSVRLRLLKDHDNKDLADLHLRLDPHSMRVVDEDVRPGSERPKNARRFRVHSGGARGAEAEFGACAER